jgi:hypothetical protein
MYILNLSAEPEGLLRSWLPHDARPEKVVFLPDACPGKSPLPTGTALLTRQSDWRRFAVSDCGCGMRLLRTSVPACDLTSEMWDKAAWSVQANKGRLGDLGGGNHFTNALLPYNEDRLYILIHTGSRQESGLVDAYVDQPGDFEDEFERVSEWARANREAVQQSLEDQFGPAELVLDLPHNSFEKTDDGVIIRKGAVKLHPGQLTVIPSHMSGDVSLVRATEYIVETLSSMSHGTGRTMSRSAAKEASREYNFTALRQRILMPTFLNDASLTTEAPYAYRDLDACLQLIGCYVREEQRFSVVAYMGHL